MDNIERTNTVLYELYCNKLGPQYIQEPEGWMNDVQSLERDKDSKAIIRKIEVDLKFYGNAAEYLTQVYEGFGPGERVIITKFVKGLNDLSEQWELRYVQEIDLRTYKRDEKSKEVSVKATEGGLYYDIKDREGDEYDILTNDSADGKDIGDYEWVLLQPVAREIFIESLFEGSFANYRVNTSDYKESVSNVIRTIPLALVYNSDAADIYEPIMSQQTNNERNHPEYGGLGNVQEEWQQQAFIFRSEQTKDYRVVLDLDFTIDRVDADKSDNEDFKLVQIITEIGNDGQDVIVGYQELQNYGDPENLSGSSFSYSLDRTYTLLQGQSLGICFYLKGLLGNFFGTSAGHVDLYLSGNTKLRVVDKTEYPSGGVKAMTLFRFMERLVAKITGKTGILRSSVLEPGGEYGEFLINNGFWARGFPDEYDNSEGEPQRIQFKTSWEDAMKALKYLEPMAWFTEVEGTQQVVRIEPETYVQQNFIGVDIGEVDDLQYEASKPDYFGTIELGHSGNMTFEEINGLDEFSGHSVFNSHLRNSEGKYEAISPYRFDSVRYELTKRKNFVDFPNEDTPGDDYIWIHDCRYTSVPIFLGLWINLYTHRIWSELGYDEAPKGIFSPDTAWNLDLSPMNRLFYKHGYSVKRGLYHSSQNAVRFASSNANQNLVTIKNGIELQESGAVTVGSMPSNRVQATKIKVKFNMTQKIEQKFLGQTNVGGQQVPNVFGLVKFSKNGTEQYGRIIKLSNKKESSLELIKAGI